MCAYGMCIPARIPVAYASVYPAYGPSQMSLSHHVSINLSALMTAMCLTSWPLDNPRLLDDLDSGQ